DIFVCQGYEFGLINGQLFLHMSDSPWDNGTLFGPAGADLRDGSFHHVAVTVQRASTNGGRLYVDGQVVLAFNPTLEPGDLSNTWPLHIGNHATGLNCYFKGRLDEVGLYGRALLTNEIQAIYYATNLGRCAIAPAIIVQPTNRTVAISNNTLFVAVATGTAPLSYQWYLNGNTIASATNTSYAILN